MNEGRLTIEEQLEEIKECGNTFNSSQYYCLYKYDIERIIPYITNLQQENKQLKEDYNKVVHEATAFESKVYELEEDIKGLQQERNNLINSIPFKENKHYKHIIDELEKWLEDEIKHYKEHFEFVCKNNSLVSSDDTRIILEKDDLIIQKLESTLNKLQELKGSDKE